MDLVAVHAPAQLAGMEIFGVRILGFNDSTLHKVLLSLAVLAVVFAVRALLGVVTGLGTGASRRSIWVRKSLRLALVLQLYFEPRTIAAVVASLGDGLVSPPPVAPLQDEVHLRDHAPD